jgi:Periplasmic binding protein-like domain
MAVSHLLGHGHKKIACIGYDKNFYSISHRILGYTNAMRASGLKCDIYDCASTFKSIIKIVRSWKRSASPPTAIFSLNNVTTSHVLQALQREGFAIPHQMAVVGFDDFALASLLSPPLTAVRQPATNLGTQAARLLFDRIGRSRSPSGSLGSSWFCRSNSLSAVRVVARSRLRQGVALANRSLIWSWKMSVRCDQSGPMFNLQQILLLKRCSRQNSPHHLGLVSLRK